MNNNSINNNKLAVMINIGIQSQQCLIPGGLQIRKPISCMRMPIQVPVTRALIQFPVSKCGKAMGDGLTTKGPATHLAVLTVATGLWFGHDPHLTVAAF